MLGVALTAQRAGWAETPARAIIQSPSTLGYRTYQTPSFSMEMGSLSNNSGQVPFVGELDVEGIGDLPGANNKRCVIATTFKLNWQSGLEPGPGNFIMNFFNDVKFYQPGFTEPDSFWGINAFTQFRDNLLAATGRMETPDGIFRSAEVFGGDYEEYNNRWLTFIYAEAETSSVFANFNPGSPSTGTYYGRSCVYDTETQALIQTLDIAFSPPSGFVPYLDYEGGTNIIGTDQDYESNNVRLNINTLGGGEFAEFVDQTQPWYINNIWCAFGSTFDPAAVPDTSLFTTRPSRTIGDAEAWFNIQFVEANTGGNYQVIDQGESRYSESNDYAFEWNGVLVDLPSLYNTAEIPKDRNI